MEMKFSRSVVLVTSWDGVRKEVLCGTKEMESYLGRAFLVFGVTCKLSRDQKCQKIVVCEEQLRAKQRIAWMDGVEVLLP